VTRTEPRPPDLAEQQTRDQAVNDGVVATFVASTSDCYREVMAGLVGHLHGFADGVSCAARVLAQPGGDVACVGFLVPLSRLPRGPSRRRSAAATIRLRTRHAMVPIAVTTSPGPAAAPGWHWP
jgi:hypothetical protein